MANKTYLGVDIGNDQLKLALVTAGRVTKTVYAAMPENLMNEGKITSPDIMSDLIRDTMKTNHMRANKAAYVIPSDSVYVKNVKIPQMTVDQLVYNLPFEFNDYITGEVKDYIFDYAVLQQKVEDGTDSGDDLPPLEEEDTYNLDSGPIMELMAVGAQRSVIEQARDILKKAGLKMAIAAPALCTYISLIRAQRSKLSQVADEYCILDLGYSSIRMYMFKGDRHMATRVLEIGLSSLDSVLADAYGVDTHLAHTYLLSNFENCQEREECMTSYDNIAIELMRALNFYRFSNPDSSLSDLWLCGGGAVIRPLTQAIDDMLDMDMHTAEELVPRGENIEECCKYIQAIGITLE